MIASECRLFAVIPTPQSIPLLGRRRSTWAEHMRSRRRVRLIVGGRASETSEGTLAAAHGNVASTSHFLPVATSDGI